MQPALSVRGALVVLAIAGALVAFESELLVGALEKTVEAANLSRIWVGLIVVPIVGNAAEHSTAVRAAVKRKTDLAVSIAVGSSAQVAHSARFSNGGKQASDGLAFARC